MLHEGEGLAPHASAQLAHLERRAALDSREQVITERLATAVDSLTPDERRRLAEALPVLALLAERL
ncbi:hypothetical protein [Nonomuraea sp. 10N515B]|uniref:hypothetical protein n=1 Tax=Nonomuraea sp. 10N515B TaxID=3457422 RepID=UPI003FCEE1D7